MLGFADRLEVLEEDYRAVSLPSIHGATLFLGNPPYLRHHAIGEAWKAWYAETAAARGIRASRLAGLHLHFFLKTLALARPGDLGAFVTSAEWIDVNYGAALRRLLADGLGGLGVHVLDPRLQPFADALTTAAVTCFRVGQRSPDGLLLRRIETLQDLDLTREGRRVPWPAVEAASRWSPLARAAAAQRSPGRIELGELFRVHRGQVTGGNAVWIAGPLAARILPARLLVPAVTRARELIAAGPVLSTTRGLRRIVDLPVDLGTLPAFERELVDELLAWARSQGADQTFIARHRRAWWSVGLKPPAPILCTYMARRAPAFVRNLAGARHLNIAHGLYPRQPMEPPLLDAVCAWLRANVGTEGGRTYAGGLTKFEPREIERLLIPRPELLQPLTARAEAALAPTLSHREAGEGGARARPGRSL